MNDNLHPLRLCLNDFDRTAQALHNTIPNFEAVELMGERLRETFPIRFSDLHVLFQACQQNNWWFDKYWDLPTKTGPLGLSIPFGELDAGVEAQVIRELLEDLKHIELVSIVLRFVRPDQYGILSPPVQQVLNVSWGSDAVQTYVNYLQNVRELQAEVGFDRVADVDKALWVLHAKCFGRVSGGHELRMYYTSDPKLLGIRAKNLLGPFRDLAPSVLARAMKDVRGDLAAVLSCYLFEVAIRAKARNAGIPYSGDEKLDDVLRRLGESVDRHTLDRWHVMKQIRNNVFHHDKRPDSNQTDRLIREIESIERSLPNVRLGTDQVI